MTLIFKRNLPHRFIPYWKRFVVADDNILEFKGNVPQRFVPYWKQVVVKEEDDNKETSRKKNKRSNEEYDETSPPLKTRKNDRL